MEEGISLEVAGHALDPLKLPISPFLLLAGPAVALRIAEMPQKAFAPK